jgi:hypothetical protein
MRAAGIPTEEFCTCGYCQNEEFRDQCVCCHNHDAQFRLQERGQELQCIHQHPGVDELLADAPLELAWNNYKHYHGEY